MWKSSALFAALVLLPCVALAAQSGAHMTGSYMTIQVEPRTEECFYEDLKAGDKFLINFEVIRGGLLDIEYKMKDPHSNIIYQRLAFFNHNDDKQNEAEGEMTHSALMSGQYAFCFDNSMSRWTAKVVSFRLEDIAGCESQIQHKTHQQDVAKLEHLGPTVDSVVRLNDQLESVLNVQHHMRVREQVHRDTAESTNSRVMYLTFLESFLLLSIAAVQIFYIRGWFSDANDKRRRV